MMVVSGSVVGNCVRRIFHTSIALSFRIRLGGGCF